MNVKRKIAKNNIQKYRVYYGLTQKQLSEKTGIPQQSLRLYERHEIGIKYHRLKKIADIFTVNINSLIEE